MNNNTNNNKEIVVDVPYYTRDLCNDNEFRLARRIIKSQNILKYRMEISEIKCDRSYFQTNALKKIDEMSIKISK